MKTTLHRYVLALGLLLASFSQSYSQCAPPTAATVTPTVSSCINNGKITISGVSGGAAVDVDTTLEYAIVSYSGEGPAVPGLFQSSNVFSDLYPGTYSIAVRHNCQGNYSTEYIVTDVNVTGTYKPISATAVMTFGQSGCRLGKVTVTATDGYTATAGAYRYQTVKNITSSLWDTLSARQTSNIFNLAAGTHYIRIYDDCGAYVTRTVTVTGDDDATNPYGTSPWNRKRFARVGKCDSFVYQFFNPGGLNFSANNLVMGGTKVKTYLYDPTNKAIDSSALTTAGTISHDISSYIAPAYLRTAGTLNLYGPFYEKIVDSCGTVFYSDSLYIDTTYTLTATLTRSNPRCDTANYTLALTETGSNFSGVSLGSGAYRVRTSNLVSGLIEYTNDSGVTWTSTAASADVLSTSLADSKWGIKVCDKMVWLAAPATVAFDAAVLEANPWACIGNTGLYLNPAGNFGSGTWDSTTIQFTSVPAGYTYPLSMVFTNRGRNAADATDLKNYFFNLPVGTYDYTLTNQCGQTNSGTVNANTGRVVTPVITVSNDCGTGRAQVQAVINTTQQGSSAINTAGGMSTRLRYTIRNSFTGVYLNAAGAAGTAVNIAVTSANRSASIAALNSKDTGWYVITVWPDTTYMKTSGFCVVQDSVHVSDTGSVLMSTSQFSSCKAGGTGTITVSRTGGIAPFKYEVLDVTSKTVYGPQTSAEFTGLNVSHTYEVKVTDTCGNTSSNRNTFDTVSTKVIRTGTGCLGTDVELRAAEANSAVYRWMRGTDTVGYDRVLPITALTYADSGMYTLIIRTAACADANIDSFKLVVNSIPAAPTVTTPIAYCKDVTATALTATGSKLKWYTDATGGAGSATAPVPVTSAADTISFFVSQTSAAGCESPRAELTVRVNPLPADAPTATTPITYCSGVSPVALSATGDNLLWFTAATGGTGSTTAPTPSTASAGTTKFYVAQSTEAGCAGPRKEISVVVNATPAAPTVTTPVVYCQDAATTALSATGSSLLWYTKSTGGTGDATAPVPSSAVPGDTIWYVSQTSAEHCEGGRATIAVKINPLPAAPVAASPVNLCDDRPSATLTATGTSLKWYTVATGGTGSATAPTPSTAGVSTTSYFVSQTTAASCEGPRTEVVVNVNPSPSVTIAPKDRSVFIFCPGVGMTIEALSATATEYAWSWEGTPISAATADTLKVNKDGDYTVTVTNIYGCTAENTVHIIQDTSTPSVLTPTELSMCKGNSVLLYCHPGFSGYTFEWFKDGSIMVPATTTGNTRAVNESGVYTVRVTNPLGCIMITNPANVNYYPDIPKPTVVRVDPVLSLDKTYPNYQWYRNGTAISGANKATYTLTMDGDYHCYVSDKNGCRTWSDTVYVRGFGLSVEYPGTTVQSLKLFPNPTSSKVFVEASEPVNVLVTDVAGQVVIRSEQATEVDLQQLADGMYLFHISDQKGLPVRIEKINKVSR